MGMNSLSLIYSPSKKITIEKSSKRTVLNGMNTGYAALLGLGATMITGASKNKFLKKSHFPVSCLTMATSILHLIKVLSKKTKSK